MTSSQPKPRPEKQKPTQTIVSKVFSDKHMLELLYAPRLEQTALVHWNGKSCEVKSLYEIENGPSYVPVKASNNLIRHGVLKLPSFAVDYKDTQDLLDKVQAFIHRYVDLEPDFEIIAAHYVLMTWVYDRFRELPYLRLTGDYGTGKTRFLQVVGSICYKPIFASGASTPSPIFHTLDSFGGTLVLDEADFRFSDAKSEIAKILNNGNLKGFPVLRSEGTTQGKYNPRAFQVFGPKIIATRGHYTDPALESRFIHERTKSGHIRSNIPITLPDRFEQEALTLRNQLLMFRFRNWHSLQSEKTQNLEIEVNRIAQIFRPLLTLAQTSETKHIMLSYAQKSQAFLKAFRSNSVEEQLLLILKDLQTRNLPLSIKSITQTYQSRYAKDHTKPITAKWIGSAIRSRLHIHTVKRQGVYIIPHTELPKLEALFSRYDIAAASTADTNPAS